MILRASVFLGIFLTVACATNQTNEKVSMQTRSGQLQKGVITLLNRTVFEVVVPKYEDKFIQYERELPTNKLDFKSRNDKFVSIGTAFAIGPNRFASAAHVFSLENFTLWNEFYIRDASGKVFKLNKFYKYSQHRDLVEFDVNGLTLKTFLPFEERPLEVGTPVYTVGNAQGEGISIRGGEISSFTPEEQEGEWNFIRFSAPASPGNSGGPLLSIKGKVLGIVTRKNESENLNFALPASEFKKLSNQEAEFLKRNVTEKENSKTLTRTWSFKFPLPAAVQDLAKASESSQRNFYEKLYTDFYEKNKDLLIVNSPSAKEYLKSLIPSEKPIVLKVDGNDQWQAVSPKYETVSISKEKSISFAKLTENQYIMRLDFPTEESLGDVTEQPDKLLENIFKALSWSRKVADEDIRILSYGAPQETSTWKDVHGRYWKSSIWRTKYLDRRTSLDCSPTPGGAVCLFMTGPNSVDTFAIKPSLKEWSNSLVFSYYGYLKDWKVFLKLKKEKIPVLFHNARIDLDKGKSVGIQMAEYFGRVESPKFDEKSILILSAGFHPENPKDLVVRSLMVMPESQRKNIALVTSIFEPSRIGDESAVKEWEDMNKGKAPYDGKLSKKGELYKLNFPALASNTPKDRAPASKGKSKIIYLYSCLSEESEDEGKFAKSCKSFKTGLKVK